MLNEIIFLSPLFFYVTKRWKIKNIYIIFIKVFFQNKESVTLGRFSKKSKKIKIGEGGQNYAGLIQRIEGSECARVNF